MKSCRWALPFGGVPMHPTCTLIVFSTSWSAVNREGGPPERAPLHCVCLLSENDKRGLSDPLTPTGRCTFPPRERLDTRIRDKAVIDNHHRPEGRLPVRICTNDEFEVGRDSRGTR
jgi:hypothetical protein